MSLLLEKQQLFAYFYGRLICYAYKKGYKLTLGETHRTPEQSALNSKKGSGIANSLHTIRLAADINLFIDGKYQTDSSAYYALGKYWKKLHPLCRWGGDFTQKLPDGRIVPKPDGNHFSIEHNSVK